MLVALISINGEYLVNIVYAIAIQMVRKKVKTYENV
jgi:hypothetical protein